MNPDVRSDMVSLHSCSATGAPRTGQAEVVCAFAANVRIAQMVVEVISTSELSTASTPFADELPKGKVCARHGEGRGWICAWVEGERWGAADVL